MNIIDMYFYLFYKFHTGFKKLFLNKPGNTFRATMAVIILELWLLFSILNYIDVLDKEHPHLDFFSLQLFVPFVIIILLKFFTFNRDTKTKYYEQKFDNLPIEMNEKGTRIVIGITVFIISNLVISSYLYSNQ